VDARQVYTDCTRIKTRLLQHIDSQSYIDAIQNVLIGLETVVNDRRSVQTLMQLLPSRVILSPGTRRRRNDNGRTWLSCVRLLYPHIPCSFRSNEITRQGHWTVCDFGPGLLGK
jgi:hypothetical protein